MDATIFLGSHGPLYLMILQIRRFRLPNRAKVFRPKVTNVLKSDESFTRRIISLDENFALQSFA